MLFLRSTSPNSSTEEFHLRFQHQEEYLIPVSPVDDLASGLKHDISVLGSRETVVCVIVCLSPSCPVDMSGEERVLRCTVGLF